MRSIFMTIPRPARTRSEWDDAILFAQMFARSNIARSRADGMPTENTFFMLLRDIFPACAGEMLKGAVFEALIICVRR